MKLDDYFDLWSQDSKIDRTELGEESIKIPQLHHKYYKHFSVERLTLTKLQEQLKSLKKDKFEYFSGVMAEEDMVDRGWEPNQLRILKSDLNMYIEADKEIIDHTLKIAYTKEKVSFLEDVLRALNTRSFQISNAIKWEEFKVGI